MQQYTPVGKQGVLEAEVVVKEEQFIASPNGKYALLLRNTGNLCLYPNGVFNKTFFWHANCAKKGVAPHTCKLQKDGNLVITDSKQTKIFESFKHRTHKAGVAPFRLVVQDNREMVIMDKNNQVTFKTCTALKEEEVVKEEEKKPSVEGYFPVGIKGVLAPEVVVKEQQYIASENDEYAAVLRKDGNLCLYPNGEFSKSYYWNAGCAKKGVAPYTLKLQKDGNLVITDSKNTKVWESFNAKTFVAGGVAPFKFVVQNDREMVVVDKNGKITFRSRTALKKPVVEEEEEEEKEEQQTVIEPPKKPEEEQKKPNPNPEEQQKKPNPVPQPKPEKLTKEQQLQNQREKESRLKDELQTLGLEKLMENVKLALGKTNAFADLDQAYLAQQQVIEGEKLKIHQQNQQRILQAQAQGQNVAEIQEEVNDEYNIMSAELQAELATYYRNNQLRIQSGQGVDSGLDDDYQKAIKRIDNLMDRKAKNLKNTEDKIAKLSK